MNMLCEGLVRVVCYLFWMMIKITMSVRLVVA